MVDKNMLGDANISYNQRHTVAKMKFIDLKTIKLLSSPLFMINWTGAPRYQATINKAADERVEAVLEYEGRFR